MPDWSATVGSGLPESPWAVILRSTPWSSSNHVTRSRPCGRQGAWSPARWRPSRMRCVPACRGAIVDGYHGDAALTVPVGEVDKAAAVLLETTERGLWAAIERARPGNRLSDISHAVGRVAHAAGYGIVPDFGGHGIGRVMHEDPSVQNDGR